MSQIDALKCLLLIDSPPKNNWEAHKLTFLRDSMGDSMSAENKIENRKSEIPDGC